MPPFWRIWSVKPGVSDVMWTLEWVPYNGVYVRMTVDVCHMHDQKWMSFIIGYWSAFLCSLCGVSLWATIYPTVRTSILMTTRVQAVLNKPL
jgi:hypothetical protein